MAPHRRKKKGKNGVGGSDGDRYRRRRWSSDDDSSTTERGSGKLRGIKRDAAEESALELSAVPGESTNSAVDNSSTRVDDPDVDNRQLSSNLSNYQGNEPLEPIGDDGQPTVENKATLEQFQDPSAVTGSIQQPGATTRAHYGDSGEFSEGRESRNEVRHSAGSDTDGEPTQESVAPSPAVPRLKLVGQVLGEPFGNKRYSLRWADGKKGKQLMRAVEMEIQTWLCAQEGKGVNVCEELLAISNFLGANSVSLGPLARQLCLPDSVACALGLRLWKGKWDALLGKIEAARDFLDLKAEAACSDALAAFGGETCSPESSHHIPLDVFACLAECEAAAVDLVELELRQAMRAEASRVAPSSCVSSTSSLFSRLDPFDSGVVAARTFEDFCVGLLEVTDIPPTTVCRDSICARDRGVNLRQTRGPTKSSTGVHVSGAEAAPQLKPPVQADAVRLRRINAVITRILVATSPSSRRTVRRTTNYHVQNRSHSTHCDDLSKNMSSSSQPVPSTRLERTNGSNDRVHVSVLPETVPSNSSKISHIQNGEEISLDTFGCFVEGKRFGSCLNLEGFLRALTCAGRTVAWDETDDAHSGQVVRTARDGLAVHTTSDSGRPRTASAIAMVPQPDTPSENALAANARWGGREVRRLSAQFTRTTSSTGAVAQAKWPSSGRLPDGHTGRAIDHGPTPRHSTPRSGSATSRHIGNNNSARSSAAGTAYTASSTRTSRAGLPGGLGLVVTELSAWDLDDCGALSARGLMSATGQGLGIPLRRSWAEALVERFQATGVASGAVEARPRWCGGVDGRSASGKLDIGVFTDFLRLKNFYLSVMTPFGLMELAVQDPLITLGGLRELLAKKMFWRQHNCNVRRPDRNNFTVSRHYGSLPLDTESPDQRRKLVADVLRPGELLFITDRLPPRRRGDPRVIPKFSYMMGRGRTAVAQPQRHASTDNRRRSANDIITAKTGVPTTLMANRRRQTVDAGGKRTDVGKGPGETFTSLLHHTSSTRRRASETAIEFSLRSTSTAEGDCSPTPDVWALEGKRGAPRPTNQFRRHSGVAATQGPTLRGNIFEWSSGQVEQWIDEAMELDRYRTTFHRKMVTGADLTGLTGPQLQIEFGISNKFHVRKLLLHLQHLVEGALGPSRQHRIPQRVSSWRTLDVMMWCWQQIGTRDRQTLAALRTAAIDGHVLLAMTPADWDEMSATSPAGCRVHLAAIASATQSLVSRKAITGTPLGEEQHCRDGSELARGGPPTVEASAARVVAKLSADSTNNRSRDAENGKIHTHHLAPPENAQVEETTSKYDVSMKDIDWAGDDDDVSDTASSAASAGRNNSSPDRIHATRSDLTATLNGVVGADVARKSREGIGGRRSHKVASFSCLGEHSGQMQPPGHLGSNSMQKSVDLTSFALAGKDKGQEIKSRWKDRPENGFWSEADDDAGSSAYGSDTDVGGHILLQ